MKNYIPALVALIALILLLIFRAVLVGTAEKEGEQNQQPATPETTFVSIGTGGVTGVYYQVGGALMKLLNEKADVYGLKASFQATAGSVYNINAVLQGTLELGVAQSDRQYQAVNGLAEWEKQGPQKALRAICSVHPEAVTLVAAADTGINTLDDLRGKKVNIGNPGSGQRQNAIDVLQTKGIDFQTNIQAEGVKAAESAKLLQDGRIDAFFYTVGHPAGAITEATVGRRPVRFIPIVGMQALIDKAPYYAEVKIPITLYPKAQNESPVPTIGVMTTLVTSEAVPEDIIYTITKELFESLDQFRSMHPAFAELDAEQMVTRGISAPFHAGALRYFTEAGLLPR